MKGKSCIEWNALPKRCKGQNKYKRERNIAPPSPHLEFKFKNKTISTSSTQNSIYNVYH